MDGGRLMWAELVTSLNALGFSPGEILIFGVVVLEVASLRMRVKRVEKHVGLEEIGK